AVDANEAFAFVLHCFHPEAEACNTTNDALEFFAKVVLHVLHLLVFVGGAFRFHCRTLSLTAVLALLFEFLVNACLSLQNVEENAVREHIRIPSNWGGEMAIMFEAEP